MTTMEAPEIPGEQLVHYIVKDYRRMFLERARMDGKIEKYRNTIGRMNNHIYALHRVVEQQEKIARTMAKMLKKAGLPLPKEYTDFKPLKFR